jgi:hypothetical protein
MKLLLVNCALALCACEPVDHCRVNDTRCSGSVAQVCDSDQRWVEIMNCDEVAAQSGGLWACQALDGDAVHTCLPVEEDASVEGGTQ